MSQEKRITEEDVDGLVRAYLTRIEQTVDSPRMIERIVADVEGTAERLPSGGALLPSGASYPSRRRWRRWPWGVAGAAAILLVALLLLQLGTAQASPEALVREARAAHALPVDRCYLIETEWQGAAPRRDFPLLAPDGVRLWTRGDRFRIESTVGKGPVSWGRDEQGRIWLAVLPRVGVRFDEGEAPESLAFACDVYSLRLETLLDVLLKEFDLHREPGADRTATQHIIATLKPGGQGRFMRSARLEVDSESKVVKKLVLDRVFPHGFAATVTLTLVESTVLNEASYELEGNLKAPYRIHSRGFEPERRREMLIRRLGRAD